MVYLSSSVWGVRIKNGMTLHVQKHDSQEAYFINGQALAVYLKMFKIVLSMIFLLYAFSWF